MSGDIYVFMASCCNNEELLTLYVLVCNIEDVRETQSFERGNIMNKNLDEIIGTDSLPALVKPNGEIVENITTEHAPEWGSYGADFLDAVTAGVDGWKAVSGFSGQHDYDGALMHPSEFIGGGLEKHILETPGYYAVEVVADEEDEDIDAGWVLLHKPLED